MTGLGEIGENGNFGVKMAIFKLTSRPYGGPPPPNSTAPNDFLFF